MLKRLLLVLLPLIINVISPVIREFLVKFIYDMEQKAKLTLNPFDDFFVSMLKELFLPKSK